VTSFAEVWIGIFASCCRSSFPCVTSFAEVWIEIPMTCRSVIIRPVISFAKVWIEIMLTHYYLMEHSRHFLRRSVD
ncbi:hypothetical protein WKU36_27675, partial [Blautia sp. ICN-22010]